MKLPRQSALNLQSTPSCAWTSMFDHACCRIRLLALLAIIFAARCATCRADEAGQQQPLAKAGQWQLDSVKLPTNCWAGRLATCSLALKGPAGLSVKVDWRVATQQRVWQRGGLRVNTLADKASDIKIQFQTPPVNPGLIAGAILQILVSDQQDQLVLQQEYPLWIFPDNPFEVEAAWLKSIPIEVLAKEPTFGGKLKELGLLERPVDPDRKDSRSHVLLVGSMASWDASITTRIQQSLSQGQKVLCLSTGQGQVIFDAVSRSDQAQPIGVLTASADFVNQIDPRLSVAGWQAGGLAQVTPAAGGRVRLSLASDQPGWIYFEGNYDDPETPVKQSSFARPKVATRPQFIYCGLDIVTSWDESPTARYLLARMLERLCRRPDENLPAALQRVAEQNQSRE